MVTMKSNGGRLQTAEHILTRTLESKFQTAKFVISKFTENAGQLEISADTDLRKIDRETLEKEVNATIRKNLKVNKYLLDRENAVKDFDLTRVPSSVRAVRIVEIEGFDKTPCKDPHVENTREIGFFEIVEVSKAGKDRYRFVFKVE